MPIKEKFEEKRTNKKMNNWKQQEYNTRTHLSAEVMKAEGKVISEYIQSYETDMMQKSRWGENFFHHDLWISTGIHHDLWISRGIKGQKDDVYLKR